MFGAALTERLVRGKPTVVWTVMADYRAIGGEIIHVCMADSEFVARETARQMNEARK